jgi:hypothetical protein
MGSEVEKTTEAILEKYAPIIEQDVHTAKVRMGVKHFRHRKPTRNRVKLRKKSGGVQALSLGTNKGEVLGAHKGVGGRGNENRIEKPFINEPMTPILEQLADELAVATGDMICVELVK